VHADYGALNYRKLNAIRDYLMPGGEIEITSTIPYTGSTLYLKPGQENQPAMNEKKDELVKSLELAGFKNIERQDREQSMFTREWDWDAQKKYLSDGYGGPIMKERVVYTAQRPMR
jgi:hypothetical protein